MTDHDKQDGTGLSTHHPRRLDPEHRGEDQHPHDMDSADYKKLTGLSAKQFRKQMNARNADQK